MYIFCCCLRQTGCVCFWNNFTFLHLRIDLFENLFQDQEYCNEAYIMALRAIIRTSNLTCIDDKHLAVITAMVAKFPDHIPCSVFQSFNTDYLTCKRPAFWDLYLCLIGNISHNTCHYRCHIDLTYEIFTYLFQYRHRLIYFDNIWNHVFGIQRITWFKHHYMMISEDTTDKKKPKEVLFDLISSVDEILQCEWLHDVIYQSLRGIYPEYLDEALRAFF